MTTDKENNILLLTCIIMCLSLGAVLGYNVAQQAVRTDAVRHGAAHWTVDDMGVSDFQWNKQISDKEATERRLAAETALNQFRKQ